MKMVHGRNSRQRLKAALDCIEVNVRWCGIQNLRYPLSKQINTHPADNSTNQKSCQWI